MNTYWINRMIQAAILWVLASVLVFLILHISPGDPADYLTDDDYLTPAQIEDIREFMGLNEPIPVQYAKMISSLVTGDLISHRSQETTISMIATALPTTMVVVFTGMIMTVSLAIPLGAAAGRRPGSVIDRFLSGGIVTVISFPNFVFGLLLIFLFAETLGVLPASNIRPYGTTGYNPLLIWPHMILPGMATAFASTPIMARYVRDAMQDILAEDFVRTAYAKGLRENQVLRRHVLRNVLVPVVSLVGTLTPLALGGSVIIETIFSLPGLGLITVQAALLRDYPVVMTNTLFVAIMVIGANFLVDLLYGVVDPRIRLS